MVTYPRCAQGTMSAIVNGGPIYWWMESMPRTERGMIAIGVRSSLGSFPVHRLKTKNGMEVSRFRKGLLAGMANRFVSVQLKILQSSRCWPMHRGTEKGRRCPISIIPMEARGWAHGMLTGTIKVGTSLFWMATASSGSMRISSRIRTAFSRNTGTNFLDGTQAGSSDSENAPDSLR